MSNGKLLVLKKEGLVTFVKESGSLPTPTTMDSKEESLKHATKMLQGKTHRSSGQPIQKTLSDTIMMDQIKQNPELMKIYQDHQMEERLHLPTQEEFVNYLRGQTTIKELAQKTQIKKTTIEHWFRKDKKGFSYPSIEHWQIIKPHLKTIKFDMEMTTTQTKEWTNKEKTLPDIADQLPTPNTMDHLPQRSPEALKNQMEGPRKGRTKLANLREAVNPETVELFNTMKNLPTPRAAHGMSMRLSENMAKLKHKGYLETEIAAEIHENLPTPCARDPKDSGKNVNYKKAAEKGKLSGVLNHTHSTQTGEGTYLNPHFVEEMMGYPIGWTDFVPSEIA
tara:strand:- start:260 stop:1267 length:1008 start_codon:yes stop_codon:yes gene_type:complete